MSASPNNFDHLSKQDLSKLNIDNLTPLTREVISRQATMNIGTIGHVAHGKSTVVRAITGVKTQKSSKEAERNITIDLGYANAKIYRSKEPDSETGAYKYYSYPPTCDDECPAGTELDLLRHVSFIDCPGHEVLMSTMMNGAAVMDAALLLIAADAKYPQPQTLEHLKAVEIMQLKKLILLQNKVDLVSSDAAKNQRDEIVSYMASSVGFNAPLLPISAQFKHNVDILLEHLIHIPIPTRQLKCPPVLAVARSFDINVPGSITSLKGGIAGGSLLRGVLKVGMTIHILPGITERQEDGSITCRPFESEIMTLNSDVIPLQYAIPGGLIGVGTNLDPSLTRNNKLIGSLLGEPGKLPETYSEIDVVYSLLDQMVGSATIGGKRGGSAKVTSLQTGEALLVNIGTSSVNCVVVVVAKLKAGSVARLALTTAACCSIGEKVAISRHYGSSLRLVGWGNIRRGVTATLLSAL